MRALVFASLLLAGCGEQGEPFTLYRNSQVDPTMRIFFASFDAPELGAAYNLDNCQMVARALNANISALAKERGGVPRSGLGFWCEPGPYKKSGPIPFAFDAEYPTSVR